mgnify:CR=1 FL=1
MFVSTFPETSTRKLCKYQRNHFQYLLVYNRSIPTDKFINSKNDAKLYGFITIKWLYKSPCYVCVCKFTDTCTSEACLTSERTGSKRLETKHIIERLKKTNPYVENNIFKSMENVNLEMVISYKDRDGVHSFLDDYDSGK